MNYEKMIDASTAHLSSRDVELLNANRSDMPRSVAHEYGWIVFAGSDGAEAQIRRMKRLGVSKGFRKLYRAATKKHCILINFDADADVHDGVPTYER